MKKTLTRVLGALVAVVLLATACGGSDGSIEVLDARYRLSRSDLGAGYLTVTNTTGSDVTLQAASAPGIGRIELHESLASDDGVMSMEPRPDGFVIPAGETVSLQPGGKHLMLFDAEGTEDLTITLDFGDESIEVLAAYDADASAAAMSDDAMDDMDHSMDDMEMDDMDHSDDAMDDAMDAMNDADEAMDDAMDAMDDAQDAMSDAQDAMDDN